MHYKLRFSRSRSAWRAGFLVVGTPVFRGEAYLPEVCIRRFEFQRNVESSVVRVGDEFYRALDLFGSLDVPQAYSSSRFEGNVHLCLLYTSPSPRDRQKSRMPSSA